MHVEIAAAMDRSSASLLKRHYSHEMNRHDHPQSKRRGEVQSCTNALIRCTTLKINHVRSAKYLLHEDEEERTFWVDVQLLAKKHLIHYRPDLKLAMRLRFLHKFTRHLLVLSLKIYRRPGSELP